MTKQTQHTARQLAPAIGAEVLVRFESLTIACRVQDAKNSWGQVRLLVAPVAGRGEQWIELGRLVAAPQEAAGELWQAYCQTCPYTRYGSSQRDVLRQAEKHQHGVRISQVERDLYLEVDLNDPNYRDQEAK